MIKGKYAKNGTPPEAYVEGLFEFDRSDLKTFTSEIVESILVTSHRLRMEEEERLRKIHRDTIESIEIIEHNKVPLESFLGLHRIIASCYSDDIQYAVSASFRKPYTNYSNGVLLKVEDHFEPMDYTGTLNDIAPGVHFRLYHDEFAFDMLFQSCRLTYIESEEGRFIELGNSDFECLATIAFLAISKNDMEPLYDALIQYISSLMVFDAGKVDLVGYHDVVEKCDKILSYENPAIMKRHILLTGPPGCGKSMIAKKIAEKHPEYTRCCLTRVKNWISWMSLISKIVRKCSRKVLIIIDEVDELGLQREENGESVYELLRLMDGVDDCSNLTFLATTNRLHDLDEALLRPGRFWPVFYVDRPTKEEKKAIIEYYQERHRVNINPDEIIGSIDRDFTGADIRAAIEDCLLEGVETTTDKVIVNLRNILLTNQSLKTESTP